MKIEELKKIRIKCPKCGKKKFPNSKCSCGYSDIYYNPYPKNPIIR